MSLLSCGGTSYCSKKSTTLYVSGTNRYFRKVAEHMNIHTTFVDATDVECVRASMKPNTKVRSD